MKFSVILQVTEFWINYGMMFFRFIWIFWIWELKKVIGLFYCAPTVGGVGVDFRTTKISDLWSRLEFNTPWSPLSGGRRIQLLTRNPPGQNSCHSGRKTMIFGSIHVILEAKQWYLEKYISIKKQNNDIWKNTCHSISKTLISGKIHVIPKTKQWYLEEYMSL